MIADCSIVHVGGGGGGGTGSAGGVGGAVGSVDSGGGAGGALHVVYIMFAADPCPDSTHAPITVAVRTWSQP